MVAEFSGVTFDRFATEIQPANQPAVLKGLIADWPMVRLAGSDESLCDYMLSHDRGDPYGVYVGAPSIGGHFFYGADTRSENFHFGPAPLKQVMENLLVQRTAEAPQSIYIQSAELRRHMPDMRDTSPRYPAGERRTAHLDRQWDGHTRPLRPEPEPDLRGGGQAPRYAVSARATA